MKKTWLMMVLVLCLVTLAACGSNSTEVKSNSTPNKDATATPVATATLAPTAAPVVSELIVDKAILDAANKEGKVVISGPPGDSRRTVIVEEFQKKYPGIKVEMQAGAGRDFAAKLVAEHKAGLYNWDLRIGGPNTPVNSFKPNDALAPLKDYVLPENLKDDKWLNGFDAGWMDNDKTFVYAFNGLLWPSVYVNREFVSKEELSTIQQLLDPKWKDKISWDNPMLDGGGGPNGGHLLMTLGEDFVKQLLQNGIVSSDDLRQQIEWLIRGKNPIAIGVDPSLLKGWKDKGVGSKIEGLSMDKEEGTRLTPGFGSITVFNHAPHANATKVFVNWFLSQQGQQIWTTTTAENSRRTDVKGPPETAPDPKRVYKIVNAEQYYPNAKKFMDDAKAILTKK